MNVAQVEADEQAIIGCIPLISGKPFNPIHPDVDAIRIEDIAHALSLNCRFTGHVMQHYSVAQHCCLVSDEMFNEAIELGGSEADAAYAGLWGLLHDASEAYLCDMSRMVKRSPQMIGYREIEHQLQATVYRAFGLIGCEPAELHAHDLRVGATEARDLLNGGIPPWWPNEYKDVRNHLPFKIEPWPHVVAKSRFLSRYQRLTGTLAGMSKTRTPAASFSGV